MSSPPEKTKRRLAAILAADIAGYSRLMGQDDVATVHDLKGHQAVVLPLINDFGGRIIDTSGDGILAEFPSAVAAVQCAIEIQRVMAARNRNVAESRRMQFRVGINLGDVIHDEARIYGDGINVAARLENIAEPGAICISEDVYRQVRDKLTLPCRDLGEQALKNIARPVRVYAVPTVPADGPGPSGQELRVGDCIVDTALNEVRRDGQSVRLEPKAVELLQFLANRPGKVVAREELLSAVWSGVVVGDDALTQAIIKLRKALGDDAHRPTYIETISKRGYRLIAPVEQADKPVAAPKEMGESFLRRNRLVVAAAAGVLLLSVGALVIFPEIARTVGMPWPIAADNRHGAPMPSRPLIAVLPLTNLSGDSKRDYFSDGVTEDVINALGRFSGLGVLSRTAVEPYKGKSPTPRAIMDELGARYIVKGSVREADGKLRVSVELSDAEKGMLLWSERYDGEGREVFEIQDRIVKNIVGTLAVKLTRLEQMRVLAKPVESLQAYDLVLRARSLLLRRERAANREARALLAQAQKLAPDHAESYIAMAEAEVQRAVLGMRDDPEESVRNAEQHAKRAQSIDDANSRVHSILALIHIVRSEFDQALHAADRALELNSSDSMSHSRRGQVLLSLGRIDEAIASYETGMRFDPGGYRGRADNFALAYYTAGRYRDALAVMDAMVTLNPDLEAVHATRAAALAQLGNEEEAKRAADQVRRLNPFFRVEQFGTRFVKPEHTAKIQDGLRKAGL